MKLVLISSKLLYQELDWCNGKFFADFLLSESNNASGLERDIHQCWNNKIVIIHYFVSFYIHFSLIIEIDNK